MSHFPFDRRPLDMAGMRPPFPPMYNNSLPQTFPNQEFQNPQFENFHRHPANSVMHGSTLQPHFRPDFRGRQEDFLNRGFQNPRNFVQEQHFGDPPPFPYDFDTNMSRQFPNFEASRIPDDRRLFGMQRKDIVGRFGGGVVDDKWLLEKKRKDMVERFGGRYMEDLGLPQSAAQSFRDEGFANGGYMLQNQNDSFVMRNQSHSFTTMRESFCEVQQRPGKRIRIDADGTITDLENSDLFPRNADPGRLQTFEDRQRLQPKEFCKEDMTYGSRTEIRSRSELEPRRKHSLMSREEELLIENGLVDGEEDNEIGQHGLPLKTSSTADLNYKNRTARDCSSNISYQSNERNKGPLHFSAYTVNQFNNQFQATKGASSPEEHGENKQNDIASEKFSSDLDHQNLSGRSYSSHVPYQSNEPIYASRDIPSIATHRTNETLMYYTSRGIEERTFAAQPTPEHQFPYKSETRVQGIHDRNMRNQGYFQADISDGSFHGSQVNKRNMSFGAQEHYPQEGVSVRDGVEAERHQMFPFDIERKSHSGMQHAPPAYHLTTGRVDSTTEVIQNKSDFSHDQWDQSSCQRQTPFHPEHFDSKIPPPQQNCYLASERISEQFATSQPSMQHLHHLPRQADNYRCGNRDPPEINGRQSDWYNNKETYALHQEHRQSQFPQPHQEIPHGQKGIQQSQAEQNYSPTAQTSQQALPSGHNNISQVNKEGAFHFLPKTENLPPFVPPLPPPPLSQTYGHPRPENQLPPVPARIPQMHVPLPNTEHQVPPVPPPPLPSTPPGSPRSAPMPPPPPVPLSKQSSASLNSSATGVQTFPTNMMSYKQQAPIQHGASFPSMSPQIPAYPPSFKDFRDTGLVIPTKGVQIEKAKIIDAVEVFRKPGRETRPDRFVIILRGLPGSGKSYLAKAVRDIEVSNGGSAPRIHSMDDYFMTEVEKVEENDSGNASGALLRSKKRVPKKVLEYCYEPEMEEAYRASMLKAFRKTIEEGLYTFIIVDDRNLRVADFAQFWATAKRSGYEVYLLEAPYKDPAGCAARNVHNFTVEKVQEMAEQWEAAPSHYLQLDISSLIHGENEQDIAEVEMDTNDVQPVVENQDLSTITEAEHQDSSSDKTAPMDSIFTQGRWVSEDVDVAPEPLKLKDSKWSNTEEDDSITSIIARKADSNALSGLIQAYGKGDKCVHWADQHGKDSEKGFSIGIVHRIKHSLIIGPGAGYNEASNPVPEEDEVSIDRGKNSVGDSVKNKRILELLRAEQETFKAVKAGSDRRRPRIGGLDDEDE